MGKKGHAILAVEPGSIAQEMDIQPGDELLAVNGKTVADIFDYQFFLQDEYIEMLIKKAGGGEWLLEIEKDYGEDVGIKFENGLMDAYRACHNQCIFCFIDQMPKGMRDTLYFKDDDSRLSFLQGNYVTLTNMGQKDVERIIRYRLAPINISFHTTNKDLRCKMLNNRFAGRALAIVDKFFEAELPMHGQIVLCKGINDGAELERTIADLMRYLPFLESVSVVPAGLTKYRKGLYPLEPFTKEDAAALLETVHAWQKKAYAQHGVHFIHASDEWYILAQSPLPEAGFYDGFQQLENGVGMLRLLLDEFTKEMAARRKRGAGRAYAREVSLATGVLAYPYIRQMAKELCDFYPLLTVHAYPVRNEFFGEQITVSGLLTGQDIAAQLKGKELGETLFLPCNVLRSGEEVFLDDMTLKELAGALQVKIDIVKSSGQDFVSQISGRK